MKRVAWITVSIVVVAAAGWQMARRHDGARKHADARNRGEVPAVHSKREAAAPMEPADIDLATSGNTGDVHSMAVSALVDMAKKHQPLAATDMQTLLAFIDGPKPEGLTDGDWETRVNVILNALRVQETYVPGLTDYLLTTAARHPSRILRLFAMQHLTLWYHRETSEQKRREIVALLEALAEKPGEETAGSAVLFLNDLQRGTAATGGAVVKADVIDRAALKLAADTSAKHDVRISALHTCCARNIREILPAARQIAADTSAVIPLRKAAVYSIGQLGAAEDRELLKSLGKEVPDLRPATGPALKSLQARGR